MTSYSSAEDKWMQRPIIMSIKLHIQPQTQCPNLLEFVSLSFPNCSQMGDWNAEHVAISSII